MLGSETSALGARVFQAFDPASGEPLPPRFVEAAPAEVDRAFDLAAAAFPIYRARPAGERAAFLESIAEELVALGDAFIERALAETALARPRLDGERARTVNQLRLFAGVLREGSWVEARIDTAIPDRKPLPKPDLRRMLVALGPAAVFGASNFPFAYSVAGGDTASALAAGCPVVVKAHPAHPGTSELAGAAIRKAVSTCRMPEGVFSMLHGASNEVGLAMARHPAARAVAFTGSLRGGRALFDAAAARPVPIPVYAEMGSVNPVFLLPGALRERGGEAAQALAQSVTLGAGQFCTNPGLLIGIRGAELDRFRERLSELIAQTPPATMLHPGILENYRAGVARLESSAGVRAVSRAATNADAAKCQAGARLFAADAAAFLATPHLAEEVFGPSTLLVAAGSRAELEEIARRLDGHLTATVHGSEADLREHRQLIAILETKAGRLVFNGVPTGVEVCPSIQHGGPYPATTDSRTTSVGTAAISRFARPVCYQDCPQAALPEELRDGNPRGIWRLVDNEWTRV